MAAKDLITLARAYDNLQSQTQGGSPDYDALIGTLITACSDAIEKYCRRYFVSKFYDELYNGNGDRRMLLRQYPVQSVQSVRYRPVTIIKIINNDQATNQQARVQVTSTGLNLWRMASGNATSNTVTFESNVTIAALATAVTAIGSGWSAQVVGDDSDDYGLWPSADLYWPTSYGDGLTSQGNLTARGQNCELKMHTYELAGYQFDTRGWLLRAIPYTDPELIHPEDLVFPEGINNFRVQYTAGYSTIPESVQEACAEWVARRFALTLRDASLQNLVIGASGNTNAQSFNIVTDNLPPPSIRALLAPYRRHTVGNNQG